MQRYSGEVGDEKTGESSRRVRAGGLFDAPRGFLRRRLNLLLTLGLGALAVPAAIAQVSSDGDLIPVELRGSEAWGIKGSAKGFGVVWHLETKTQQLATLLVTGDAPGALREHTEYSFFAEDLAARLASAWSTGEAVFFKRARPQTTFSMPSPSEGTRTQVSRRFVVSKALTHIRADPKDGVFVYHLRSRTPDNERVDHFLRVRTGDDAAPALDWFVDSGSAVSRFGAWSEQIDRQWAVEPYGSGLLTPVDEAVGHLLAPEPQR